MREFSCFALVLCTLAAQAQSNDASISQKKVYLNSVLGVTIPGFSALNTELQKAGYLPLRDAYLTRGAGFYTLFPKLRLASIFNFSSYSGIRSERNQSNWVRASTAGTSLGIIVSNNRMQVIPYGGLMFSWLGVRVTNAAPASGSFGGYLAGPSNQHHVALNQFMGNVGLHVAKVGLGQGALSRSLLVGIRAGYGFPLAQPNWKTNDVTLNGGPSANGGGAYLNFILGSVI